MASKASLILDVSQIRDGTEIDANDVLVPLNQVLELLRAGRVSVSSVDTDVKVLEEALTGRVGRIKFTKVNPAGNEQLEIDLDADGGSAGQVPTISSDGTTWAWADVTISGGMITGGVVDSQHLADGAVTTPKIADGAVTSDKLASDALPDRTGAFTAADETKLDGIEAGAEVNLTTEEFQDAVGAMAGTGLNYDDAAGTLNTTIQGGAVDTSHIADGAVTTPKLANQAVTDRKIAPNSVASGHLKDAAVTNAKIENNAVTERKIASDSIVRGHLQDNVVGTDELVDNNVTEAKLASAVRAKLNSTGVSDYNDLANRPVLSDVSAASADTVGKMVLNGDDAELTKSKTIHNTTPASATWADYSNANYLGAFSNDPNPVGVTAGRWYFNIPHKRPRLIVTAGPVASWADAAFGAVISGSVYIGEYANDAQATLHANAIGNVYWNITTESLRRNSAFTAASGTDTTTYEFLRVATADDVSDLQDKIENASLDTAQVDARIAASRPWKDIHISPDGFAGDVASLSQNLYLFIEDKVTSKNANRIKLDIAGTQAFLATNVGSPDQATLDRFSALNVTGTVFQFSLERRFIDNLVTSFGTTYNQVVALTITFTDGSTYTENLGIVADSARFPNPSESPTLANVSTALGLGAPAVANRLKFIQRKNDDTGYQYVDAPSGGGGGGGLSAVISNDTLTGDGTNSSPLQVANPFTAADETKLDGIAAGAEVNRTQEAIEDIVGGMAGTGLTYDDAAGMINATSSGGLSTVASDATITGTGATGSPLSVANPFTDADESKLDGIAAGAEVNVKADWTETDTNSDAFIENKPARVGAFTAADERKLDGIEAGAEVNLTTEEFQDAVGAMAGSNLTYDDSSGRINATVPRPPSPGSRVLQVTGTADDGDSASYSREDHVHNLVTSSELSFDNADNLQITDGGVATAKLADDAVTNAKIADNAVQSANIGSQQVTQGKIASNAVTTGKIATNAVTNAKLADDAVGIAELSASGTPSASTYLRGDNSWAAVDVDLNVPVWTSGLNPAVGDIVRHGSANTLFMCIQAVPAGSRSSGPDGLPNNYLQLNTFIGDWSAGWYQPGSYCLRAITGESGKRVYVAIQAITNSDGAPESSNKWRRVDSENLNANAITAGTLPIARGGTGATTASAARTALGAAGLSDATPKAAGTASAGTASAAARADHVHPGGGLRGTLIGSGNINIQAAWSNDLVDTGFDMPETVNNDDIYMVSFRHEATTHVGYGGTQQFRGWDWNQLSNINFQGARMVSGSVGLNAQRLQNSILLVFTQMTYNSTLSPPRMAKEETLLGLFRFNRRIWIAIPNAADDPMPLSIYRIA